MAEAPEFPRPRERVADVVRDFPEIGAPRPTTFLELTGTRQMSFVLGVICVVTVAFLVAWWASRPALQHAEALLRGSTGTGQLDADKVVETLGKLQRDHTEHFRNVFQLVVMSALVPLFTLLAGYVFGRSHSASQPENRGEPEK